ncbi:MAG: hypothetical protein Q8R02_14560 [Hyphomonadaceae bacterium]|nr:hypothetical protein [Hyphomonadaceae bacterium]
MTKFLRRDRYDRALDLARKARRRGDVVAADRWLKHADRMIAHGETHTRFVTAARVHDIELEAAKTRVQQAQTPPRRHIWERLDELVEQYEKEDREAEEAARRASSE